MKVVHLSYYYGNNVSGAPMAASRLHRALLRRGVDSHFVCIDARESGVNIHKLPHSRLASLFHYVFTRAFWVVSKLLIGRMCMPNLMPLVGFDRLMMTLKPDLIHLHFIGQDMISFSQLCRVGVPTVVTIHDLSLVNAFEPYPRADCRFITGFSKSNSSWIERWMFARKKYLVKRLHPVFTAPSEWACSSVKESHIGRNSQVEKVLNILDPAYSFSAGDRSSGSKFVLLFGAFKGRVNEYKGWSDLVAALELLPQNVKSDMVVRVFGESAPECMVCGVKVEFLGAFSNPQDIRAIHNTSDALALPSRFDNAPQVKFEALMDGIPVLAFARTGCAEFIEQCNNGWVSPDGDITDYAKGIEYYHSLWKSGELESIHATIAANARTTFNENSIVERMLAIYDGITASSS